MIVGKGACGDAALESARECGAHIFLMMRRDQWQGTVPRRCQFDLGEFELNLALLAKHAGERVFLAGDMPETSGFTATQGSLFIQATKYVPIGQQPRRALEEACGYKKLRPTSLHSAVAAGHRDRWPGEQVPPELSSVATHWDNRVDGNPVETMPAQDFVSEERADTMIRPQMISERNHTLWISSAASLPFDTAFIDEALVKAYATEGVTDIIVDPEVLVLQPEQLRALCSGGKLRLYDAGLGI